MPVEGFEVIVSATGDIPTDEIAIAEAAKYLAYADTTGIYPQTGDHFDVNVYDGGEGLDYGIGLHLVATIENPNARERFMSEMGSLSRVESVERVPYVGV